MANHRVPPLRRWCDLRLRVHRPGQTATRATITTCVTAVLAIAASAIAETSTIVGSAVSIAVGVIVSIAVGARILTLAFCFCCSTNIEHMYTTAAAQS